LVALFSSEQVGGSTFAALPTIDYHSFYLFYYAGDFMSALQCGGSWRRFNAGVYDEYLNIAMMWSTSGLDHVALLLTSWVSAGAALPKLFRAPAATTITAICASSPIAQGP
jgi:hypothetical protein